MKITNALLAWRGSPRVLSNLIIVEFQNDGDPATYSAFVLLKHETGELLTPTYFRNVAASSIGPRGEVSGEALQFPIEIRLEVEDAARKYAIEKKLVVL